MSDRPRSILVLTKADVESLLDPDELADALSRAFVALSAGSVDMPSRVAVDVPEVDGVLFAMPAYLPGGALATKLVSLFPRNAATGIDTHNAIVVTFDPATGIPAALIDGGSITAARTAAASAVSTRLLARSDARVLAILGTGVQARSHLAAVARTRDFREVRLWGRDAAKAAELALELARRLGVTVHPVATLEEATAGADVVCGTTHAEQPVICRPWLSAGVHVTSVGYNRAGREVDAETVRDATVFVESRAAALAPFPAGSNDLAWPVRDGVVTPDRAPRELGEVIAGSAAGRTSRDEITLYKSVGIAVEDAAAAAVVMRAAARRGVGRTIEL